MHLRDRWILTFTVVISFGFGAINNGIRWSNLMKVDVCRLYLMNLDVILMDGNNESDECLGESRLTRIAVAAWAAKRLD